MLNVDADADPLVSAVPTLGAVPPALQLSTTSPAPQSAVPNLRRNLMALALLNSTASVSALLQFRASREQATSKIRGENTRTRHHAVPAEEIPELPLAIARNLCADVSGGLLSGRGQGA
jgi:hypothetical protein